jgi:hypothetical protein
MTKTTYEPSMSTSVMECRDCGFKTTNAAAFNDHAHQCKVNPVPMPEAMVKEAKNVRSD